MDLTEFNILDREAAVAAVGPALDVQRWIEELVSGRPYGSRPRRASCPSHPSSTSRITCGKVTPSRMVSSWTPRATRSRALSHPVKWSRRPWTPRSPGPRASTDFPPPTVSSRDERKDTVRTCPSRAVAGPPPGNRQPHGQNCPASHGRRTTHAAFKQSPHFEWVDE